MKLSQKADYGLAAVLYLAQKDGNERHSLKEICEMTDIPEEFLRKIFQILVKARVIDSFKGKGGGVSLARSPKDISVFEIIDPLEDKDGLVRCIRGEYCPRQGGCFASDFWYEMQGEFIEGLKNTSIKDLIERGKEKVK